jgi:hypothetical protein
MTKAQCPMTNVEGRRGLTVLLGGDGPAFRPVGGGGGAPIDVAVDARQVVAVFFGEADFRAEVVGEIFAVEKRALGDTGDGHDLGGGGRDEFEEAAGVGEVEVDGGLEFFDAGGLGRGRGVGGEVAVDVFAPGADAAEGRDPVEVGADAVAEVGEDGAGLRCGGGGSVGRAASLASSVASTARTREITSRSMSAAILSADSRVMRLKSTSLPRSFRPGLLCWKQPWRS